MIHMATLTIGQFECNKNYRRNYINRGRKIYIFIDINFS